MCDIGVRSRVNEKVDNVVVACFDGEIQRRATGIVERVGIEAKWWSKQDSDDIDFARNACRMKSRPAFLVTIRCLCFIVHKSLDSLFVTVVSRSDQLVLAVRAVVT